MRNVLRSRRARLGLVAGTIGAAVICATPMAASASTAGPSDSSSSPAIVGPLLDLFSFGDTVGIPTGCQELSSVIGGGAGYYGQAQSVAPIVNAINTACSNIQVQGGNYIAQGQAADAPLAAWNPYMNPIISNTGSSVQSFGQTYGDSLAPFGPTIAGLGGTIDFFEGS